MAIDSAGILDISTSSEPRGSRTIRLPRSFHQRFELQAELGRGISGAVYRAVERRMDRPVALKFLVCADSHASSSEVMQRFLREGQLLGRVQHPNVIRVFDLDEVGGFPYLVSELASGGSLASAVDAGAHPPVRVIWLGERILAGLAACHEAGIIHRDLKPANILLSAEGEPKIADLGLALLSSATTRLTRTGTFLGTPRYMAPELFDGEEAGVASDLYAIGLILFQLAAGRYPHAVGSLDQLLRAVREREVPDLRTISRTTPSALAEAVRRSVQRAPAARFASAREMALALHEPPAPGAVSDRAATSGRVPATRRAPPERGRGPHDRPDRGWRAAVAVTSALAILLGTLAALARSVRAPASTARSPAPAVSPVPGVAPCTALPGFGSALDELELSYRLSNAHGVNATERALLDQNGFDPQRALQASRTGVPRAKEVADRAHSFHALVVKHGDALHGAELPDAELALQTRAAALRFSAWGRWRQAVEGQIAAEYAISSGETIGALAFRNSPTADPTRVDDLLRADRLLVTCLKRSAHGVSGEDAARVLVEFVEAGFLMMRTNWPPQARGRVGMETDRLLAELRALPPGLPSELGTVAVALLTRRLQSPNNPAARAAVKAGIAAVDAMVGRGYLTAAHAKPLRVRLEVKDVAER